MSSLSTVKPVTCSLSSQAKGANGTHSNPSKLTTVNRLTLPLLLQVKNEVKGKEKVLVKEASRREMMQLTAAALGLLSLFSPASAEARTRNPTVKQRFFEKFEELRRKAGLTKPKDEDVDKKPKDEKTETTPKNKTEENKSKHKSEPNETKPSTSPQKSETIPKGELAIPVLPHILNGNTIETTLP